MLRRALFVPILLLLLSTESYTCSCGKIVGPCPGSLQGAVFLGTVIDAENPGVARTPGEYQKISRYHFRVDEAFSGIKKEEVDLYSTRGGGDCSHHFTVGKQYLVFAGEGPDGQLSTSICSNTRAANWAQAFLPQLRAIRDGYKVASLFGVLRREQQPYSSVAADEYNQPLGNVLVRFTDGERIFESRTDLEGRYVFYDIPEATYTVSADLPRGLEVAQTILDDPPPPLKVPARACMEHDIAALPTGRIRGRVLAPDGKPIQYYAPVALFRADRYATRDMRSLPWSESQKEGRPFEFLHVAPGEYILVFNDRDDVNPDTPFPRTFYPDAREFTGVKRITVEDGQTVDADIHVKDQIPIRQITIRVIAEDGMLDAKARVEVKASRGRAPFPHKVSPGIFRFNLLRDSYYSVSASTYCSETRNFSRSNATEVDGSDERIKEVTLVMPRTACERRPAEK